MDLVTTLKAIDETLPPCQAVGFIDMATGALVKARAIDASSREALERAAASAHDLFLGPEASALEDLFSPSASEDRGDDSRSGFQECVVISGDRFYVFQRGGPVENLVLLVVCLVSNNMAMTIARTREAFRAVEAGS